MELSESIKLASAKLVELNFNGRYIPKFETYIKPTNHFQVCQICSKHLEKGDRMVKEMSGATRSGYFRYSYSHLDCYLAVVLHTILEIEGKAIES